MEILEILKYTLPALIVFITVWVLLSYWSRNEDKKRKTEFNKFLSEDILPVRLQAYERCILLLERISPENMLLRVPHQSLSASQLHRELINQISQEFEHNIAQQTYLSVDAWERIKAARNQNITVIGEAAKGIKADGKATGLAKLIVESLNELTSTPSQDAIRYLKQELKDQFFS